MPPDEALDQDTPEAQVAALVDEARRDPRDPRGRDRLVALLAERSPLYAGRGANAVVRLRGYLIAAFEQLGLPDEALPYVLEELETGRDAYLVAAAARALRGRDPTPDAVPFLLRALDNIRDVDDAVSFAGYRPRWPAPDRTTATEELLLTLAFLGEHARPALPDLVALGEDPGAVSGPARATLTAILDRLGDDRPGCCTPAPASPLPGGLGVVAGGRERAVPADIVLEDQDGRTLTFGEFFVGWPSVVAFFYTRCDNPNKCSLTITKLARLQRALRRGPSPGRVRTAAITYDPGFDLAPRLRAYGENRGAVFGPGDRFLRAPGGLRPLDDYFQLGVNFGQALVNRHRIELFVLDSAAQVVATFARLQWDVDEVLGVALSAPAPRNKGNTP
jgi:cytochrome oxidase Cu insertion factor (SCO1/SenC/PrrC family)